MLKIGLKYLLSILFVFLFALPLVISAQENHPVIPLWSKGTPGFENRRNEPELAKDYWVRNIHSPSITVYLPSKEKATGANMENRSSLITLRTWPQRMADRMADNNLLKSSLTEERK